MSKSQSTGAAAGALSNPVELAPFRNKPAGSSAGDAPSGTELLQAIIETPQGSRHKYSYDDEQRIFALKSTLPLGMVFPFDFGFVPQTIGGDGDPLDVLVLHEAPTFPGCAIPSRLLGVMKTEQTVQGRTERNDRLIAVADAAHTLAWLQTVDDLPVAMREQISEFFSNYHRLQGKHSRTLEWSGPAEARRLIDEGMEKARQERRT